MAEDEAADVSLCVPSGNDRENTRFCQNHITYFNILQGQTTNADLPDVFQKYCCPAIQAKRPGFDSMVVFLGRIALCYRHMVL